MILEILTVGVIALIFWFSSRFLSMYNLYLEEELKLSKREVEVLEKQIIVRDTTKLALEGDVLRGCIQVYENKVTGACHVMHMN